jgi:hypothetical protein
MLLEVLGDGLADQSFEGSASFKRQSGLTLSNQRCPITVACPTVAGFPDV